MQKIHLLSVRIVWMLGLQYLLGMLTALFGSDDPSTRSLFGSIVFLLHAVLGIGLVINSAIFSRMISKSTPLSITLKITRLANYGVVIALVAGILTITLHDTLAELSSLLMATAFLLAFASYGYLAIQTKNLPTKQLTNEL